MGSECLYVSGLRFSQGSVPFQKPTCYMRARGKSFSRWISVAVYSACGLNRRINLDMAASGISVLDDAYLCRNAFRHGIRMTDDTDFLAL